MKSLQKIQFLEMHLLQMKHPLHHKLLQNKKMKPQSRILSPLYNLQLQMMMKMKSKCLQWATKELSMRLALKRNLPVLFQPRELLLVPKPVGRMALSCQRGQKGEVRQRSPLSALTLQDQWLRQAALTLVVVFNVDSCASNASSCEVCK